MSNNLDRFLSKFKEFLENKNKKYGDSINNPIGIFSKSQAEERVFVRLDDKLSRVARGPGMTIALAVDFIGYFVKWLTMDNKIDAAIDYMDREINNLDT